MIESSQGKKSKYEIDMCNGPLTAKIFKFALPVMLSGILQLLFNAADMVVAGRYAGSQALAAVGSTGSLINLLVNLFIGLSVGANVLAARYYGANKGKELNEMVHTAVTTAFISGCVLVFIGVILAGPALHLMGTPDDVIEEAKIYMRIYFVGMPVMMVYNFGSAILRAIGDTKRPLYFLLVSGIVNVVLNLIFVILFSMSVAGVALATIISQAISAVLVVRCLMKAQGDYRLVLKELRIVPDKLIKMVKIGIPAGLQGALFSISNVLIQSSVNSFGSIAMAGNTAASNLEGFVYTSMNALHQTSISFTGQNLGAKKYKRIGRIFLTCLVMVLVVGFVLGNGANLLSGTLLKLYSSDQEVIQFGMLRMSVICTSYCLCGAMDVMVGSLRGMGYSVLPMLVSLTGACGFRILWIATLFQEFRSLKCLYISYPVSWGITAAAHLICFWVVYRKMMKRADVMLEKAS